MKTITKSALRLSLTIAMSVWLGAGNAQTIYLGHAGQYSAFILGDANGLSIVQGRVAVGRDLTTPKLNVGAGLTQVAPGQATLVVGRNIAGLAQGVILDAGGTKGYGVYGDKSTVTNAALDLRQANEEIDFLAEADWLAMLSARVGAFTASGTAKSVGSEVTLTGSNADVEIFNITAAQVGQGMTLHLSNVKPSARLLINVASDGQRQLKLAWNQDALTGRQAQVLYNLPDTDVLGFEDATVWASVLAPFACVKTTRGKIAGGVIAAAWQGSAEIGFAPFVGQP